MKYYPLHAKVGDILKISETLSLRFEKVADDLLPIWYEIPVEESTIEGHEGDYVEVSPDICFVLDKGIWRMMSKEEHSRVA